MHRLTTTFILGYHGCEAAVAERLLAGAPFTVSRNVYDWLGEGIYFWESNPKRGLQFAKELGTKRPGRPMKTPAVVGAVIDLGLCLDLTTTSGIEQVQAAYGVIRALFKTSASELPRNSADHLLRNLDCAVINTLHEIRKIEEDFPVDTVRGVFTEGEPAYPGAAFPERTHIQIAVRNHNVIKGVFRVPRNQLNE